MIWTALQLIARRSIAHMRLLSAVVAGVLLAVAIMSATFIYFDSLRTIALGNALSAQTAESIDVVMQVPASNARRPAHDALTARVAALTSDGLGQVLNGRHLAVRSATFDFEAISGVRPDAEGRQRRAVFVTLPDLRSHVSLVSGSYPDAPLRPVDGEALRPGVLLPREIAEAFGLSVGDSYRALPFWSHSNPAPEPVVAGVFQRDDPDSVYWRVYDELFAFESRNFAFAVGVVPESDFVDGLAAHQPNMTASYGWTLDVDPGRIEAESADAIVRSLRSLSATLKQDHDAYRQITGLATTLSDFETRLFFNRLPMIIVMVLVVLVVLYYATTLASLLVDAQRGEISLLRTRGAGGGQIAAVFLIEAGLLAALAIAIGPPVAATAVRYAGVLPWFDELNGGSSLPVTVGREAYRLAALGGLLSFAALFIPAIRASRVGLLTHRRQSARASGQPAFQRYYLDLASLAVAVVLLAQLQERGSVAAENLAGESTVDQVTLAIPALFLVAAGVVLLRLFPVTMELLARLLSGRLLYRLVSPTLVLGLWTMARNPAHYARLSLLFILTAGLGVFAANFGATLDRSGNDRALYETGADVRVTGIAPRPRQPSTDIIGRISAVEGVGAVSPVMREDGVARRALGSDRFRLLAVEPDSFAGVAWSRGDLGLDRDPSALDAIRYEQPTGILLPADTRFLALRVRPGEPAPELRVFAALRDANGRYLNGLLGTLEPRPANSGLFGCDDATGPDGNPGWCTVGGSAERVRIVGINLDIAPAQPLTLLSIILSGQNAPGAGIAPGTVLIDEILAVSSGGEATVIESFDDPGSIARWSGAPLLPATDALDRPVPGVVSLSWGEIGSGDGPVIFANPPVPPVPVLASAEFLDRSGRRVGDVVGASLGSSPMEIEIVGEIDLVPTVDPGTDPFLLADLEAVFAATNGLGGFGPGRQFNELWISAGDGADTSVVAERVAGAIQGLPYTASAVLDRDTALAAVEADPLVRAGWSVLLALAFGTVLVVSGAGFLVHSQVTFDSRKGEFALLRTVGLSMRQLLSLVVLEQALVLGSAIAIGAFMGARLGSTMLPFLSNSGEGVRVVPPVVVEIDWPAFGATFALLGAVVLVVVTAILFTVYRMSIQSVLRLGER